jgi:hypothetical protein
MALNSVDIIVLSVIAVIMVIAIRIIIGFFK